MESRLTFHPGASNEYVPSSLSPVMKSPRSGPVRDGGRGEGVVGKTKAHRQHEKSN